MLFTTLAIWSGGTVLIAVMVFYNGLLKKREKCDEAWHNLLAEADAWGELEQNAGMSSHMAHAGLHRGIRRYNEHVRSYNEAIASVPVRWFAEWSDVEPYRYAELRDRWLTGGPPDLALQLPALRLGRGSRGQELECESR